MAYFVLGAMVLLFGLPLTAMFVREKSSGRMAAEASHDGFTVAQGVRSRTFWILLATLFLGSISVNGAITHLSPLLTDRGMATQQAALVASAPGAGEFRGPSVDGPPAGPVLRAACGSLPAGRHRSGDFLVLSSAGTIGIAMVAAVLIGLGLGAEADITPYLLTRYFGLRSFSTLYGFTWSAYAVAGSLGPILMGRAFDASGSYSTLLLILSGGTFVSAALYLLLQHYPASAENFSH